MATKDLSGNMSNPYTWQFFSREYVDDPLAINITTGHTMLSFNNQEFTEYLESKKPYSRDFLEGQVFILQKCIDFFQKIYERGYQPNPKYLLKSLDMLMGEVTFEMERQQILQAQTQQKSKP
jgi:hypothetical protein